ncbi:cytochrome C assembly family protein [Paludibacterium paludis]|nr:cytochrome c biogenesis protein CcsA [Paludibacterium paludis]
MFVLTLMLMVAYSGISWHVFHYSQASAGPERNIRREQAVLGVVLLFHAFAVLGPMVGGAVLSIGVGQALAVVAWLMLLIYWTASFFYRVDGLQLFMMPLAVLTLGFSLVFPGHHVIPDPGNPAFILHILVSMLAYSLFAIGALLAILMLAMERALHAKRRTPLVNHLPPLLSLERMMFQVLTVGFVLLSLALLSGLVFSETVFGQPVTLTHKTVFGVISWLTFAGLLFGRSRYGWRGRIAIRWTLVGFVLLMMAYIGSKIVLELILKRT